MSTGHDDLSRRVEDLRAFEREYRSRLRLYFEDRLAELDKPDAFAVLRTAVLRVAEASSSDLKAAFAELPEHRRQRLLEALLRVPVEVTS